MKKQRIRAGAAGEPPAGTWSNCLKIDRHVYIAGMTSRSEEFEKVLGDTAYDQAKLIFGKIEALIEAAGGTMADIVKVNIFLTDIDDRGDVWKARREFFEGDFPVSTLIEISKLVEPDMKVEIEAVGIVGCGSGN